MRPPQPVSWQSQISKPSPKSGSWLCTSMLSPRVSLGRGLSRLSHPDPTPSSPSSWSSGPPSLLHLTVGGSVWFTHMSLQVPGQGQLFLSPSRLHPHRESTVCLTLPGFWLTFIGTYGSFPASGSILIWQLSQSPACFGFLCLHDGKGQARKVGSLSFGWPVNIPGINLQPCHLL